MGKVKEFIINDSSLSLSRKHIWCLMRETYSSVLELKFIVLETTKLSQGKKNLVIAVRTSPEEFQSSWDEPFLSRKVDPFICSTEKYYSV
jgi:hypothetical protein